MVDNFTLGRLISKDPELSYRFLGCFAADSFPYDLSDETFFILNTAPRNSPGEHWLMVAKKQQTIYFYDSFGRKAELEFADIINKIRKSKCRVFVQIYPSRGFEQPLTSSACSLYCLFVAHFLFKNNHNFPRWATEEDILQFAASNFNIKHRLIKLIHS